MVVASVRDAREDAFDATSTRRVEDEHHNKSKQPFIGLVCFLYIDLPPHRLYTSSRQYCAECHYYSLPQIAAKVRSSLNLWLWYILACPDVLLLGMTSTRFIRRFTEVYIET